MKRYIQDFGRVKLAVVEEAVGSRWIKTSAQVVDGPVNPGLWERLERALKQAQQLVEAQ